MAKSTQWLKKVDSYLEQLTNETDDVRASEIFKRHLDTMSKFWHYSQYNQILIMLQMPEASLVAGYQKWLQMGRQVKRGERGLKILAPGFKKDEDSDDPDVRIIRYFFAVSVFDISQTEGDELDVINSDIEGDGARKYFDALVAHCRENGADVKYESMGFGHYGASQNGEIIIAEDGTFNTKFATAVHEMAHELLHWDGKKDTKRRMETEAESISYIVLRHYGIETKAPEYLAFHNLDKKLLEASLGNISEGAKQIITAIESKMAIEEVA